MSALPSTGPLLYLRTIRRLAPSQVLGRTFRPVVRTILPLVIRPRPYRGAATAESRIGARLRRLRPVASGLCGETDIAAHVRVAEEVVAGRFRFLSTARRLGVPDWNARLVSRLWTYHLQYFGYAESLVRAFLSTGRSEFRATLEALVTDWIERTRPFHGDAWDPYPTSLRIDHWIRVLALAGDSLPPQFQTRLIASLDRQARYLSRFTETHLRGNHLIKNYKALIMAGLVIGDAPGRRLWGAGMRGLDREGRRQILGDGVHYERSPMYHAMVLEDLLHVIGYLRALDVTDDTALVDVAARMLAACPALARPDGTWHQFGDTAEGHALSVAGVLRLAGHVGVPVPKVDGDAIALGEAGFYGWMPADGRTKFLIRCGRNAPGEQPGHAHCDLLGFELWLDGAPVAVDTGVHDYEPGPTRHYARSTGAHNTVRLGGREQSEIWAVFRVGREAHATVHAVGTEPTGEYAFSGESVHYHSPAAHRRVVRGSPRHWVVTDRVDPAWGGALTSALHLHPRLRVAGSDGRSIVLRAGNGGVRIEPFGVDTVETRQGGEGSVRGVAFPAFGREERATCVEMTVKRNDGREFGYRIVATGDA